VVDLQNNASQTAIYLRSILMSYTLFLEQTANKTRSETMTRFITTFIIASLALAASPLGMAGQKQSNPLTTQEKMAACQKELAQISYKQATLAISQRLEGNQTTCDKKTLTQLLNRPEKSS